MSQPTAPPGEGAHHPEGHRPRGPISLRVVVLTLVLIPANAWWLTEIEFVRYSDNATTQALFFNAITILLALLGINTLLERCRPSWRFSSGELVMVYVAVAVASNLGGHDMLQILFTTIAWITRQATPGSTWETRVMPHVPKHLIVDDEVAIQALFSGNTTLYRWDHAGPWLEPLAWWSLFAMLAVLTMLCLASLFRRQWDAERLNYPIAEIPVQIITQTGPLFRSPALWAGCAVGATVQIVNMIHSLAPAFPRVPIGVQYFHAAHYPWNAAGPLPVSSFPFAYGLTFLLPTQLGFSCWFFFLLSRVQLVGAAMMGHTDWGGFPYVQQQGVGAILGFFLAIIYASRNHLASVWRSATSLRASRRDGEAMSDRMAVFGTVAGMAGMIWFATNAGMSWQAALIFFGILMVIVLVVARLRAELGLPTYELYQAGADQVMQRVSGTNAWSQGDLTMMTLFFWLTRTHRQFPMQTHVDALRLGKRTETPLPAVALLIVGASAVGIVAAFWSYLHSMYQIGFTSAHFRGPAIWAFGADPWTRLDSWFQSPAPPDHGTVWAYVFGCGFTLFLAAMRARFSWWPFHPAGYLVSGSFGLFRLWVPIFVSWLIKVLVLRYGGLRLYVRVLPFFLGLIFGEFVAGFCRTIIDLTFQLHLPPASGIGGL
ncbi:MAG TPA: DUF6785 family protein [Chthonomonadales bacterium]|nr:DUF6785 family protein [Chthonomonadales bacterium]